MDGHKLGEIVFFSNVENYNLMSTIDKSKLGVKLNKLD